MLILIVVRRHLIDFKGDKMCEIEDEVMVCDSARVESEYQRKEIKMPVIGKWFESICQAFVWAEGDNDHGETIYQESILQKNLWFIVSISDGIIGSVREIDSSITGGIGNKKYCAIRYNCN